MVVTYNLPDGPSTAPLLRMMKLVFQPVKYMEDYAKAYGDTLTLRNKSGNHIVYFSHPQALQQIYTADASYFEAGNGNRFLRFLVGANSLLLLDGERHLEQRQLLTPPFHGDRMRAYGDTIREITLSVMDSWEVGTPFNIRSSMQEISLRVILRVVFGLDEGNVLTEIQRRLSSLLDFMGSPLMSSSLFFGFLQKDFGALSPWGWMRREIEKIDELVYALIQERKTETSKERQDILSLMMSARYDDGQPMSDIELRDQLMTLMLAGHETTASALTWAFYWLDIQSETRAKLLHELSTLNSIDDTIAISKLPYLTAVCQESLRIYPILLTGVFRKVVKPIEIMGYKLPEGIWIAPGIYMAHHREETYPEPNKFKPERFLNRQYSAYEFIPFGGGSRRCIGSAFAMHEMKIVLATVLSKYKLSLLNKRPVKPTRRGLTVATPPGMKMLATDITDVTDRLFK
ncbi:cytochrome P450 [Dulcicalothrix desertica PCC 7102]|uniref:Cytochrome P450 n=1 Tax=Dulcicalothrix desertica PCC 7102 TaxID=232991 RepID=A0A433V9S3_9CYAN|nr:cytochrome P450 [Dulcicalothrix desertica]RUT02851.1 cytochrome P450 [Dulcicalothrix desertica PCC 7102]TWH38916.1 cytochrome P450 [Dulcicalothrix desertica PCC 7102]